jgi:2-polyprenyl-6-hydroxyphenyl methylase/3-demethylubiquinone-9 3-methyltransferase
MNSQNQQFLYGTVDHQEIASFTKDAALWWDESGPFKTLHQLNPTRLSFIRHEIIHHFKIPEPATLNGLHVVDIGCGGGLIAEPLARLGAHVTGIDAGEENIQAARRHAHQMTLEISYLTTTAEALAEQQKRFDVVVSLEIVEHVSDVSRFVQACCQLAQPNGLLIFSTLNRTFKSFALGIVAAEYLLRWVPRGTHSWHKFLKPSELATHLREHGVMLHSLKGMSFNPLTRRWNLDQNFEVNYLLSARKMKI